ncbi:MAG: hypothetical protein ACI9TV_002681 [Sulfurimonas sp.]|jgi:hypothetical protein|uniref:hypothetical protein n=1 Tax=Sulfurimonas sp. TaxID=2022749 RepID=UPI0039E5D6A3
MKYTFFLLALSSLLIANENYQKNKHENHLYGKINTHIGEFDNYNSIGGYKDGNLRHENTNSTKPLNKNSKKIIKDKKSKWYNKLF